MNKQLILIAVIAQLSIEILAKYLSFVIQDPYVPRILGSLIVIVALVVFALKHDLIVSKPCRQDIYSGALCGIGLFSLLMFYSFVLAFLYSLALVGNEAAPLLFPSNSSYSLTGREGGFFLLVSALLVSTVTAPISEELITKACLYGGIRGVAGKLVATVATSFAFSLLHYSHSKFILFFVFSCALCVLYEKTKSLYALVVAHAAYNILIIANLYSFQLGVFHGESRVFDFLSWGVEMMLGVVAAAIFVRLKNIYFTRGAQKIHSYQ